MERGGGNDARTGSGQRISEAHCRREMDHALNVVPIGLAMPVCWTVSPQLAVHFCAATAFKEKRTTGPAFTCAAPRGKLISLTLVFSRSESGTPMPQLAFDASLK